MARRKKKKIAFGKKECILATLIVVVFGLILLITNRTRVKEPKYEIYFHNESAEIFIGDEVKFGYTITNSKGNDNLMWTTSNSNVATIDETGKVKGISFGDVVITVELGNGSSSSMKLRVKSYPVRLIVNTDIKPVKGWYNREVNVTFETLNINELKYCLTIGEECTPNSSYKNKITIKNGVWYLYINYTDKNGKIISHREIYQVDLVAPKCSMTRIGKMSEETATIDVICEKDASGIDRYEWYRDNTRILMTEDSLIYTSDIYEVGKHKYNLKVYDLAGNSVIYNVDN